ncbi:MAG: NAD(P)/FAD-dependent oxidoreductase [Thermodesulfovibrionales bacterium]|nr:NAD(P)/FAD-dependent oxidoreductase [Thermodesulfovibrionales bacterium]
MRKKIVILGAGYGGITASLRLARLLKKYKDYEIHLIDKNPFHTFKTQLHEAAVRNVEVSVPIDRIIRKTSITFHQQEINKIVPKEKIVKLKDYHIAYDYLVLALGSVTNFYGIPGLQAHSLTLQSLEDAQVIYEHIRGLIEEALIANNANNKGDMLRFVIGGGGLTGVEFAGELVDFLNKDIRLKNQIYEVIVIEGGERVVPNLDEKMSSEATEKLVKKGIKIITKTRITNRTADTITLSNGEIIRSYCLVWTGGIKISELIEKSELKTGQLGRVLVNEYLQALDYNEIYALGDNALALNPTTGKPVPAAAQFALQQGRLVAENIYAEIVGKEKKPYQPKVLGEIVSLGRHLAIGWLAVPFNKKLKFIGFIGSLFKTAVEDKHILLLKKESRNWTTWKG